MARNVPRGYENVPGTYVLDAEHSRKGYALNMFCKTLDEPANRDKFAEDEDRYLDGFNLTPEQREAVLQRRWLRMCELGGNVYYLVKLAIFDRKSMQYLGGEMSGMSEAEFREMMLQGGRQPHG